MWILFFLSVGIRNEYFNHDFSSIFGWRIVSEYFIPMTEMMDFQLNDGMFIVWLDLKRVRFRIFRSFTRQKRLLGQSHAPQ